VSVLERDYQQKNLQLPERLNWQIEQAELAPDGAEAKGSVVGV
jgi:hypothetical protein